MTLAADPTTPLALIVDDDPTFRALSRMSLEQEDLRVEEAASGQAALDFATTCMPDIVILDVQMPGMDGFTTCQRLRQLPGGDFVPILVMTGLEDVESIARAYEVGATDFIIKPCHGLILSQRVRYMLRAKETLNALRGSESRLAQAQRIAQLGGWEWDLAHDRMEVSDAVCQILGVLPASFSRTHSAYLACVHEEDRDLVAEALREAVADGVNFDLDHRVRLADGTERIVHLQGEVIIDDVGRSQRMLGTVQDVTDKRATEAKIYFLANYDSLTHLPNRSLFLHRVAQAITCGMGTNVIGAVLVLSLDRYQRVIEIHGPQGGDQLLKDVADRLQHTLSTGTSIAQFSGADTTVIARLGEDQFAVLLTNLPTAQDSAKVTQCLLTSLGAPFQVDSAAVTLTASIGIAIPGVDGAEADLVLRNAVTALQAAKNKGHNSYQYYSDSMNVSIAARVSLEQDLRDAITTNQFVLYYQPQVDILSETIIGVEALIRWQHPTRGLISPAEFIPVAEEEDLIIQLSEWVIKSASRQQKIWHNSGLSPFPISINLSSLHFRQSNVVNQIRSIVSENGGDPRYLELELTEGVLMTHASSTVARLKELKESGFRLAIDDFGTGYSSLAYLHQFPIHTLKIDRAFIKDLKLSKSDSPIIRAIIGMGRALKLHVVAEGVETRDQLAFLRMQGCAAYQGFLFCKPLPPNQLQQLLRNHLSQPTPKSA
jgi:diguanylate cyclase (GGDEF)-like protein/PAS domain S-box-containing protein